jgi:GalNAc-alpha-(1->4)-GalNAc-alpha-(1->3)-diNAcBac-PP-undecaprenol alpha-1,4-N-acetyl-D-galactosaminyltransferase
MYKLIFLVSNLRLGGAEKNIFNLALNYSNQNYDVVLITWENSDVNYFNKNKITIINLESQTRNLLFKIIMLFKFIVSFKPKYVISFMPFSNIVNIILGKLCSYCSIVSERTNFFKSKKYSWKIKLLRKIFYPFAYRVVVQTIGLQNEIIKQGLPWNTVVIPNAVKIGKVEKKSYEKKIIMAGRLEKLKNYELAISLFAEIKKNIEDIKLEIYGKGEEYLNIVKSINTKGLQNSISINEPYIDIESKMLSSFILLSTSKLEGFPNVILESMSQGTPVVALNCDYGPSEIIDDAENGFLFYENELFIISQKICDLFYNKNLYDKFSNQCLYTSNLFSESNIYKKWDSIII